MSLHEENELKAQLLQALGGDQEEEAEMLESVWHLIREALARQKDVTKASIEFRCHEHDELLEEYSNALPTPLHRNELTGTYHFVAGRSGFMCPGSYDGHPAHFNRCSGSWRASLVS